MKLSRTSISVDGDSRGVELFYLNEQLPPGAAVYLLYRQEDLKRKTFSMPFDPIYIGQTEIWLNYVIRICRRINYVKKT